MRWLLLVAVTWSLTHYLSPWITLKAQGYIFTTFVFIFALQETLFFGAKAKLGEHLKSTAVGVSELGQMLSAVIQAKGYLDRVWRAAVVPKVITLVAGGILANDGITEGGVPVACFRGKWWEFQANQIVLFVGWLALLFGCKLTMQTHALYRAIDLKLNALDVEARELDSAKKAVASIEAAPVEDWRTDATQSGYERINLTSGNEKRKPKV